jgi:hypothetical protein
MAETAKNRFQSEFEALPLEEKLKTLLRLEATTLSETFNFAVNEPMKVVEKFGEVVADIGRKVEEEFKKATASRTEKAADASAAGCDPPPAAGPSPKGKGSGKKKTGQ